MKKRLISIVLTLLMVMSMFTGMSVSAYADDDKETLFVEYTLVDGDYVLRICQRMGINYYTCKDAIMKLNNISSEDGFRFLSIGQVIKIPVSDAAAIAIMSGNTTGGSGNTGSSSGNTTNSGNASGATVAYYLIPYTMQRGDTVLGVCNALGISFANYAEQIMELNGISSWNKVYAGTTLLLPSTKTPAVGTTCFAVVAHKVAAGDTAYSLCQKYGVNYGSSTKILEALNNTENLAAIKAGKNFYLPVATTILAANSNTGSSSGNNSNSGSADNSNTGSNSSNNSTNNAAKTYEIKANINTSHGSMQFYVNNKAVNEAKAGDTVTVVVTTNSRKAIDGLVVKYADGRADLNLTANSFVMPACDVRVDANISSGYNITINSNYSYKTVATVEGVSVSSASEGSSVKIVSTDPGYEVKNISVYYTTLLGFKKEVTVNDGRYFMMPSKNVIVDVELAPVKTYNFYRADCENGGFDIQVDGASVSKAAKGAKVTIVWEAIKGYDIKAITVTNRSNNAKINVFNNSFTMPASDVTVEVSFGTNYNPVVIEAIEGGILRAYDDAGNVITEAETGKTVAIGVEIPSIQSGYSQNFEITVRRNADGHLVALSGKNGNEFKMPAGGVTITGKLIGNEVPVELAFNPADAGNNVYVDNVLVSNGKTGNYKVGQTLELKPLSRDGYAFDSFLVTVTDAALGAEKLTEIKQDLSDMLNEQGKMVVPDVDSVKIEAKFVADAIEIGFAEINGDGVVSYRVNNNTAHNCKVGETVEIIAVPTDPGFIVTEKNISIINNETGKELIPTKNANGNYEFKMPAEGVKITVRFTGAEHIVGMNTEPAGLGQSMWALYVNGYEPSVENSSGTPGINNVKTHTGDAVMLFLTDVGNEKYVIEKVEIRGTDGKDYSGGLEYNSNTGRYSLWMPDDDILITVFLKDKADKTISLANVSWNANRGSVGSTVGAYDSAVVSTCKVGETVFVVPRALDPYFVEADSLSITRNSDGGKFTLGTEGDPVIDGKFYPVTVGGELVAWQYKMPEGGVTAKVDFKANKYDIVLNVTDNKGTADLNDKGYLTITATDTNTLYEVRNGRIQEVEYGAAVKVALSTAGAELYKIKSITASGVEIKNNAFWMPAKDINTLDVVLEELNPTPEKLKFSYTANDSKMGKLEFYSNAGTSALLNGEAEVGSTVYVKAIMNPGYQVKNISVKNKLDNTEICGKATDYDPASTADYAFDMPKEGVVIKVDYEPIVYDLVIVCSEDGKAQVKIGNESTSHIVKTADSFKVPYNTNVTVSMYDSNYKFVEMEVAGGTATTNTSFKMPVGNPEVLLDITVAKK